MGFPGGSLVKNPPALQGMMGAHAQSLGREDPWRRKWQPTPVFLPGGVHGTEQSDRLQFTGLQRFGHN